MSFCHEICFGTNCAGDDIVKAEKYFQQAQIYHIGRFFTVMCRCNGIRNPRIASEPIL